MKVDGADDPSRRRSRRLNLKALQNKYGGWILTQLQNKKILLFFWHQKC
jgi:hypothetical protein